MAEQSRMSGRLTASVIMSSDSVYDLNCDLCCQEDGAYLEAEGYCVNCEDFLCRDCFKGHKSTRISRDHVLQDKTQMPDQKPLQSVAEPSTKQKCARHPDKSIDYICRDDTSLGCIFCMTINHSLCNSIDHIPGLAQQVPDSQEYKQFTNTLNRMKTESQTVTNRATENVIKADKWLSDAASNLQELRKTMNEAFDKFERDLYNKANTIKSADLKKLQYVSDRGQTVFVEVTKISDELQSLQNKNQNDQLFIQMIKLKKDKVETLQKLLTEADKDNRVTAYVVEPGVQIQGILDDPTFIGNLSVKAPSRPTLQPRRSKREQKRSPAPQHRVPYSGTTATTAVSSSASKPLLKISHSQPLADQSATTATTAVIAKSATKPVLKNSSEQSITVQPAATTNSSNYVQKYYKTCGEDITFTTHCRPISNNSSNYSQQHYKTCAEDITFPSSSVSINISDHSQRNYKPSAEEVTCTTSCSAIRNSSKISDHCQEPQTHDVCACTRHQRENNQ